MSKIKRIWACMLSAFCFGAFSACGGATPPPEVDLNTLVDFVVEVESGKDAVVLQLTDPQIIDSSQQRDPNRLGSVLTEYWAKDKKEDRAFGYMRNVIEKSNPDLILLTGDLTYGEFDDDGSCLQSLITFMESFEIPWAPIMGNHEAETTKGIDWVCQQLENAEHCLFKQRRLSGNGNYSVGLAQEGKLVRVFYMMDSNGYGTMSDESAANKHSYTGAGFKDDQIAWYTDEIEMLKEKMPNVKLSFAWHIPSKSFVDALTSQCGHEEGSVKYIDLESNENAEDFGVINGNVGGVWDTKNTVWNGLKAFGVDSVFVGHVHAISASVMFEGVRLQFGQKSTTFDSANYLASNGSVVRSYSEAGTPIVGGTVITVSHMDGSIAPYIMLYEE